MLFRFKYSPIHTSSYDYRTNGAMHHKRGACRLMTTNSRENTIQALLFRCVHCRGVHSIGVLYIGQVAHSACAVSPAAATNIRVTICVGLLLCAAPIYHEDVNINIGLLHLQFAKVSLL